MGPLIPLFWTSGDVCPGFQSQGGFPHLCASSSAHIAHIPADVSTSIGGGFWPEPMTIHAACSKHGTVDHLATPAQSEEHF